MYVWSTVAAVLLALVIWEPIRAFRHPFGLLLIVGLVIAGVELLRRQTALEYPGARAPDVEELTRGGAEWLRAAFEKVRRGVRGRPPVPQAARIDQLERLAALHEKGALTDEEFAEEKAALRRAHEAGEAP